MKNRCSVTVGGKRSASTPVGWSPPQGWRNLGGGNRSVSQTAIDYFGKIVKKKIVNCKIPNYLGKIIQQKNSIYFAIDLEPNRVGLEPSQSENGK